MLANDENRVLRQDLLRKVVIEVPHLQGAINPLMMCSSS